MAANHWQFPLAGNFGFHFDHQLPIPQRPIPAELRRARLNSFLQTQFELSQPTDGPDPYAHSGRDGVVQSNGLPRMLSSPLQSFRKGAAVVSHLLLSILFGVIHYVFKLPFNAICIFLNSLDWWLVFAFFFAVIVSPVTSNDWLSHEGRTVTLVADLEYVLVEDFRRWGMIENPTRSPPKGSLTFLSCVVLRSSVAMMFATAIGTYGMPDILQASYLASRFLASYTDTAFTHIQVQLYDSLGHVSETPIHQFLATAGGVYYYYHEISAL